MMDLSSLKWTDNVKPVTQAVSRAVLAQHWEPVPTWHDLGEPSPQDEDDPGADVLEFMQLVKEVKQ